MTTIRLFALLWGGILLLAAVVVLVLGPRGAVSASSPIEPFADMVDQPRYRSQGESAFFADGRSDRMPPVGTVPWGRDSQVPLERFGRIDEANFDLTSMPLKFDEALLKRGRERYAIFCSVCHGLAGDGQGMTTAYGMTNPPSYHGDRLRTATDGHFYRVITQGKGLMGPLGGRIPPGDRWAIIAYVRALQRSQAATFEDVPEADRWRFDSSATSEEATQ